MICRIARAISGAIISSRNSRRGGDFLCAVRVSVRSERRGSRSVVRIVPGLYDVLVGLCGGCLNDRIAQESRDGVRQIFPQRVTESVRERSPNRRSL